MKNSVYSKILCVAAVSVICACIIFEFAALLWRESAAVPTVAEAENENVYNISEEDETLLAEFVYSAASDEPFICKVAVAAVIFNRMRESSFPSTVSEIIAADAAFSSTSADVSDIEGLRSAKNAVHQARNGQDPTNGALHFYRSGSSSPAGEVTFYASDMIFTR